MKAIRYSLVCLMCALLLTVTGCAKNRVTVVNTNSGVVIHAGDFTDGLQKKAAESAKRIRQVNAPTAKSSGAVIDLGSGYEKIEMGPLFDNI